MEALTTKFEQLSVLCVETLRESGEDPDVASAVVTAALVEVAARITLGRAPVPEEAFIFAVREHYRLAVAEHARRRASN